MLLLVLYAVCIWLVKVCSTASEALEVSQRQDVERTLVTLNHQVVCGHRRTAELSAGFGSQQNLFPQVSLAKDCFAFFPSAIFLEPSGRFIWQISSCRGNGYSPL